MALNQGWWAVPTLRQLTAFGDFEDQFQLTSVPFIATPHPSIHPSTYPPFPMPSPQLLKTARQVMADPALKQKLADRVLELMQEDLRLQRERARSYGGLRS